MYLGSGSWGDGSWGLSYWGDERYNVIENSRNVSSAESSWDSGISFFKSSNTHRLVSALLREAKRIDDDIEEIYEQQHINSATGKHLDQFGELVNVERKSGESDDKYRARIKATFRASTIETTYNQFTEFTSTVIDTDIQNITFETNYDSKPATITVTAQQQVYDNSSLTATEVQRLLEDGVPAGHRVDVIVSTTNAFTVKSDGTTDDPAKGLTSDSITSGGELIGDLT